MSQLAITFVKQAEWKQEYFPEPWQEEDLADLLDPDRDYPSGTNWSQMGCYKTTTGLWLAERYAKLHGIENPNVLIVTTKSGKGTYRDAIPKSLDKSWRTFNISTKGADILGPFGLEHKYDMDYFFRDLKEPKRKNIVLAHYHCFVNKATIWKILALINWDVIICDEAHRMKNRETQWTRNLKLLNKGMGHVMTGTGFINDPSEMWSPLNFLNRAQFPSYWKFREYYCLEEDYTGFRKVTGIDPEHEEEFKTLRKRLGPRRTMAEVHAGIPEPIFTPLEVELNPVQRKMYNEIKRYLATMDQQGVPIHSPNVLSQLNRCRQIAVATPEKYGEYYDQKQERRVQLIRLVEPSSKLDALMEVIDGLQWDKEEKQQLVVFSNFKDPLKLAQARFEKAGISYIWMQESDNEAVRYEKWHDTFPKKDHRVFMCTLQLGSESINLSPAQHAVFLDRSWSPKDNNQGVGRLYRPGQVGLANIIHINATRTTDQRMEATHNLKTSWFETIFGNEEVPT
jgi:SNF2 family DNA or RNA helicase